MVGIGRTDKLADINRNFQILMNLQMGTHKISMRMCFHNRDNFRSLLLCISVIGPWITGRVHKHNFLVGQDRIGKLYQAFIFKLPDAIAIR